MNRSGLRPGDFWRICDRSGFKVPASQTRRTWDGLLVRRESWEARHPQDFVRARPERQTVQDPRPRPENVFQVPDGGPFFLVSTPDDIHTIQVSGGQFHVYAGVDQPVASDL